jgi:hypothetical protein
MRGLQTTVHNYAVSFSVQLELAHRTLKPGFDVLEDSKSPRIPSKVHAVGSRQRKTGAASASNLSKLELDSEYVLEQNNAVPGTMTFW